MLDFPFNITFSDVIDIAAFCVAADAQDAARKANEIADRNSLRPPRLEVYRSMQDFAHYCCTYPTFGHGSPSSNGNARPGGENQQL